MSVRRRKKAIGKVVKLLNLATSTNTSESTVALRHAESLIREYCISQRELPILQLCDRSTLYKVSWGSAPPKFSKEERMSTSATESVYQRRFSEKAVDPDQAYATVRTILDDIKDGAMDHQTSTSDPFVQAASTAFESMDEGADNMGPAQSDDEPQERDESSTTQTTDNEQPDASQEQGQQQGTKEPMEEVDMESAHQAASTENTASAATSFDNVINATNAFRPNGHEFCDALRSHYATSDPSIPFSEDGYWAKIHERLADFDEAKVQSEMEALKQQLHSAEKKLKEKKQYRVQQEQEELQERSERARIEQSFEEAMERAFLARAKAYERWEREKSAVRLSSLREEQDALYGVESLAQTLTRHEESFKQHLQRKEDYRAAKIMHELRYHLALSVSSREESSRSYDKVLVIMEENGLSLKDLEFSDIKNKSLFIRLLERETALIDDVHQREQYTEEMLDKFLTATASKKQTKVTENPIQHIQRLLVAANEGGQFETQKSLEQVVHLMGENGISVRDVGYEYIKKYSVFIRLINWEAESIASLSEREAFTAAILEEYVQHSVQTPSKSADKSKTQKTN